MFSIEDVRLGNIPMSLTSLDEFSVLWCSANSSGVYVPKTARSTGGLILAEACEYEPMSRKVVERQISFEEIEDDYPFETAADQLLINLEGRCVYERHAEYEEGEIQGITYAVDAILFGGVLRCKDYREQIADWADEIQQGNSLGSLDEASIQKYRNLGFMVG